MRYFCEQVARQATAWAGSTAATIAAFVLVIAWIIGGFFVGFDDMLYQMVINTATTIITFLLVFLIQRTQNKDSLAIQLKLNELIAAHEGASNKLLNIESLSETEIAALVTKYMKLSNKVKDDPVRGSRHTVDELDDEE